MLLLNRLLGFWATALQFCGGLRQQVWHGPETGRLGLIVFAVLAVLRFIFVQLAVWSYMWTLDTLFLRRL